MTERQRREQAAKKEREKGLELFFFFDRPSDCGVSRRIFATIEKRDWRLRYPLAALRVVERGDAKQRTFERAGKESDLFLRCSDTSVFRLYFGVVGSFWSVHFAPLYLFLSERTIRNDHHRDAMSSRPRHVVLQNLLVAEETWSTIERSGQLCS